MTIYATAGAKLYIGVVKEQQSQDLVLADFSAANAVTWKEIKETEGLGTLGDSSEAITFAGIADSRSRTIKGVRNAAAMEVVCGIDPADPGQIALIAAEKTIHDYEFRLVLNDAQAGQTATVTISIASPGVVSWVGHGLSAGKKVKFSTTGSLPTGLVAGTTYYVIAAGLTADAFQLSATAGGSAIVTSGTQSGTHAAATVRQASERLFIAKVMSQSEQFDQANNVMKLNASLAVNSNVVRVNAAEA